MFQNTFCKELRFHNPSLRTSRGRLRQNCQSENGIAAGQRCGKRQERMRQYSRCRAGKSFFGEETFAAFLSRDRSDGYTGDYVLAYRPVLEGGSVPMGTLDGYVETTTKVPPAFVSLIPKDM